MNFWQGKRMRLRAVEPSDGQFLYELSLDTDMEKMLNAIIKVPMSLAACIKKAEELATNMPEGDSFYLVIEDEKGRQVGMINPHHPDPRTGVFRYGIRILPAFRRKGYAQEAILILLRYFFDVLCYQKCNVGVYSFNQTSAKLHESLGFVKEGVGRRVAYVDGRHYDAYSYGITVEEFRAKHGASVQVPSSEGLSSDPISE